MCVSFTRHHEDENVKSRTLVSRGPLVEFTFGTKGKSQTSPSSLVLAGKKYI